LQAYCRHKPNFVAGLMRKTSKNFQQFFSIECEGKIVGKTKPQTRH